VKTRLSLLLLLFVFPFPLLAEDVQVRIYSAHPPDALTIIATEGQLHWKPCSTCKQQTDQELSIKSPQSAATNRETGTQKNFFITGSYELQPVNGPTFSAHFPLRVHERVGGLVIVVTMPMQEYLQHVLMAESGDFQNPQALKAMAVVARSYAKKFTGQHGKEGFDFCDTTHCQAFHWKNVSERVRSAVESTSGVFLSYHGKVAATYYHQSCGGSVAAASEAWAQVSEPYLLVHSDPFCLINGGLKWEAALTHDQIDRALYASGLRSPVAWKGIEISSRSASGRVHTVNLSGGKPATFSLSASSLRFAVDRSFGWNNIRSDLYESRNSGDKVIFSGRGAGHGVGLCQAGAEEMAREGKSYREILSFYFPGTQLTPSQQEAWQKRSDERFDLISSNPEADSEILPATERILREAENTIGWRVSFRVKLQVFSSLENYRNTTGQAGWVAASTRGQTIRLQRLAELRRRSILESTLRHEIYHLLVETRTSQSVPSWFREGLVLYFSSPDVPNVPSSSLTIEQIEQILKRGDGRENTERAYVSAHRIVAALIQQHGKQAVLDWLSDGLPDEVIRSLADRPTLTPDH
jgi:stage II sporulation protein D